MRTKKPKKRNPNDLTLRNLRALKKRIQTLEDYVDSKFLVFDDIWRVLKQEIDRK